MPGHVPDVPRARRGGGPIPVRHRRRRGRPTLRPEAGFGYETGIARDRRTRRGVTDAPRPLAQENVLITDPQALHSQALHSQALHSQAGARASRRQDRAGRTPPAIRAIADVRVGTGAPLRGTRSTTARS